MHNRKIIKFGKTSFVISLPISWLRKNDLVKGDVIDISEKDYSLIISPTHKKPVSKVFNIMVNEEMDVNTLFNRVKSAYLSNYDTIKLKGKNIGKKYDMVSNVLNGLKALEVVDIDDNEITIKDYVDKETTEINDAVLKSNILITKMFEMLINNYTNEKKNNPELKENVTREIEKTDNEINKTNNFIIKLINYKSNKTFGDTEKLLVITKISLYLELIGDQIKAIARLRKNENINTQKEIKTAYEFYKKCFNTAYKLLHKGYDDITPLVSLKSKLTKDLYKQYEKSNDKVQSVILHKLINIKDFSFVILMSSEVYKMM